MFFIYPSFCWRLSFETNLYACYSPGNHLGWILCCKPENRCRTFRFLLWLCHPFFYFPFVAFADGNPKRIAAAVTGTIRMENAPVDRIIWLPAGYDCISWPCDRVCSDRNRLIENRRPDGLSHFILCLPNPSHMETMALYASYVDRRFSCFEHRSQRAGAVPHRKCFFPFIRFLCFSECFCHPARTAASQKPGLR